MKLKTIIAGLVCIILLAISIFIMQISSKKVNDAAVAAISDKVIYVSPNGNDNNSGSLQSPLKTLQKAADSATPGTTVIVKDGIYSGGYIVMAVKNSGTSDKPITFKSENKYGAKIFGENNKSAIGISVNADYINIKDFEIYGFNDTGITNNKGGKNTIISGNKIHTIANTCVNDSGGNTGIYLSADSVLAEKNLIYNIGRFRPGEGGCNESTSTGWQNLDHGIYIKEAKNIKVYNNIFYNNDKGWPIHLYSGPGVIVSENIDIQFNTFAYPNPARDGHILIGTDTNGLNISNNIFYNPNGAAIRIYSSRTYNNFTISNNIATSNELTVFAQGDPLNNISYLNNFTGINPQFNLSNKFDFTLRGSSPAVGKTKRSENILTDFNSNNRSNPTTVGAIEANVNNGSENITPQPETTGSNNNTGAGTNNGTTGFSEDTGTTTGQNNGDTSTNGNSSVTTSNGGTTSNGTSGNSEGNTGNNLGETSSSNSGSGGSVNLITCPNIDVNGNGRLNLTDFAAFVQNYGIRCKQPSTPYACGSIDTNKNGKVDLIDLANFAKRYNKPNCGL